MKVVVFVDGCFWHGCPLHATSPRNNAEWWREKLDANIKRDRRNDRAFAALGWTVVRVWEHETTDDAVARIRSALVRLVSR
jgi:DNA mismatch endonuclease (patch repair protein)